MLTPQDFEDIDLMGADVKPLELPPRLKEMEARLTAELAKHELNRTPAMCICSALYTNVDCPKHGAAFAMHFVNRRVD